MSETMTDIQTKLPLGDAHSVDTVEDQLLHREIAKHLADLRSLDREDLNYELRKYGLQLVEVSHGDS